MKKAPVNRIIPFSNVDGPGNRTSIFFQGCTFHCLFCHNPETMTCCKSCGICLTHCPVKALRKKDGKIVWDSEICVQCDTCLKVCPYFSSPRVTWMTVEEVLNQIRRAMPYIDGITTSGGDCTLYPSFLKELFTAVKQRGKTCLIDANGAYDFVSDPALMDVCDGVMLDVKAVEPTWHRELVSFDVEPVLRNLDYLLAAGKLQEVRTVILPNRDRENSETVQFVSQRIGGRCPYKIIRYRPFGVRPEYRQIMGEEETDPVYAESFARLAREKGASAAFVV